MSGDSKNDHLAPYSPYPPESRNSILIVSWLAVIDGNIKHTLLCFHPSIFLDWRPFQILLPADGAVHPIVLPSAVVVPLI